MKNIIVLLAVTFITSFAVQAQSRFKIAEPYVTFFAGTPLEDIDANSDKLVGVLDVEKKSFAFRIAMNTFQFKRELMQEHFNENYLETDKYPNSEFRGIIKGDFDISKVGEYAVTAEGKFSIHNIEKEYSVPAVINVTKDTVSINAVFPIQLKDHDIKIPTIVLMKIAEKADVTVKAKLVAL